MIPSTSILWIYAVGKMIPERNVCQQSTTSMLLKRPFKHWMWIQDKMHCDMNVGLHQRSNCEEQKKDFRKHQMIQQSTVLLELMKRIYRWNASSLVWAFRAHWTCRKHRNWQFIHTTMHLIKGGGRSRTSNWSLGMHDDIRSIRHLSWKTVYESWQFGNNIINNKSAYVSILYEFCNRLLKTIFMFYIK